MPPNVPPSWLEGPLREGFVSELIVETHMAVPHQGSDQIALDKCNFWSRHSLTGSVFHGVSLKSYGFAACSLPICSSLLNTSFTRVAFSQTVIADPSVAIPDAFLEDIFGNGG